MMYAVYGIPPDQLYAETVNQLLPSYLRRTYNERDQQAILISNKIRTLLFGNKTEGAGEKKETKGGGTNQPTQAKTRSDVTYMSASQLMASMKARSVRA